ncbi:unnamed protein product [Diplocarpon coronariae]
MSIFIFQKKKKKKKPPSEEYIPALLSLPQNAKADGIIDSIRRKHPHAFIEYQSAAFTPGVAPNLEYVPEDYNSIYFCVIHLKIIENLRFIHLLSAGVNHPSPTPIWTETNISIPNSSRVHSPSIVEWVLTQILSHTHQQKVLLQWQQEHQWGHHSGLSLIQDNYGQNIGVLGYGAIGLQTYTASPPNTPESKVDRGYIVSGIADEYGVFPSGWFSVAEKVSLHNFLKQDIEILLVAI